MHNATLHSTGTKSPAGLQETAVEFAVICITSALLVEHAALTWDKR